jgi:hypothetical protein
MKYEVVYYNEDGRQLWWPADSSLQTAENALAAAIADEKNNARISEVVA